MVTRLDSHRKTVYMSSRMQQPGDPTQLDVGDRMPLADDNWERAHQSKMKGVEGSWGDRMSFLRAHHLVPDKYRHAIVAARNAETSHFTNGEI